MSKRSVIAAVLYAIAVLFVIGFGFLLWRDYTVHYPYGSAPFYLYVIERAIEMFVPAALCLVTGISINRRSMEWSRDADMEITGAYGDQEEVTPNDD